MQMTGDEWVNEPVSLGILSWTRTTDLGDIVYWQNVHELRKAPEFCLRNAWVLSAAKLIYSGIDNLAWLVRAHDRPNVEKADFADFVGEYLLPSSGLPCDSEELYSARCGLLHCNTAESNISRAGNARYFSYATGSSPEDEGYEHISSESRSKHVVVHIEKLYVAYSMSIDRLNQRITRDTDFADSIYRRSAKLYAL